MSKLIFILPLFFLSFSFAQILPPQRSVDWKVAGLKDTTSQGFTIVDASTYGFVADGVTPNDSDPDENETINASGKVKGYAVVNMDTRYKFNNSGWQVFAKASNIFNKKYATGGMLGENWFEVGNNGVASFSGNGEGDRMLMVGAPRAAWIGMRYDFGKPKGAAANVDAD